MGNNMGVVDGIIVDVVNRTSFPGTVTYKDGVITDIKKAEVNQLLSYRFSQKLTYILPPFIDSHLHLDMTMLSPCEYARLALSQGVAGAIVDCHDISSVLGKKGILALIENSKKSPFYFGFSAPANIFPGVYEEKDIEELLKLDEVTHLGEIKDFPSVILHEDIPQRLFELAVKLNKKIDGHAPGLTGVNLKEFCLTPVSTDHEVRSFEEGYEKIKAGLKLEIQTRDSVNFLSMKDLVEKFPHKTMLCSEIVFGPNIKKKGYLNEAVKKLVNYGVDVFNVLQASCVNPVKHYGLKCGLLQKGDSADFIVIDGFSNFNVLKTYIKGECVFDCEHGDLSVSPKVELKPLNNVTAKKITEKDIEVICNLPEVKLNVIDAVDDELNTIKSTFTVKTSDNKIISDISNDILKVVLVSRTKSFNPVAGFVHGFGIKKGAFAISLAHEEHNFGCVGYDDRDIVTAINRLIELKGGMVYALDGKVICQVRLDFGGIISTSTSEAFEEEFSKTREIMRHRLECTIKHPIRTLSYLFNTSVPSLKLSPKGLFSVPEQEIISLWQQ